MWASTVPDTDALLKNNDGSFSVPVPYPSNVPSLDPVSAPWNDTLPPNAWNDADVSPNVPFRKSASSVAVPVALPLATLTAAVPFMSSTALSAPSWMLPVNVAVTKPPYLNPKTPVISVPDGSAAAKPVTLPPTVCKDSPGTSTKGMFSVSPVKPNESSSRS